MAVLFLATASFAALNLDDTTVPAAVATSCTGISANLPVDQCNAWIALYDKTAGDGWTVIDPNECPECKRTDPCGGCCDGYDGICSYVGPKYDQLAVTAM